MRIKGDANDALLELSRRFKLDPVHVVENLLIHYLNTIYDDELCAKDFFKSSMIYQLELPFSFPYECEKFEFSENLRVRLYLERVPKRYVKNRLPFRTIATILIELTPEDEKIAKENEIHITNNKLNSKYSIFVFDVLKEVIINYRRVTGDYYNIGVIEPPWTYEEFQRKVKLSIIMNQKEYVSSHFMPVKEDSYIEVARHLEEDLRSKIIASVIKEIKREEYEFLLHSNEYLDAAKIFYYHEQWNLCLLQSVIAMESALADLVFNSKVTHFLLRNNSLKELRIKYKNATGLPKKIKKFLFPLVRKLGLNSIQSDLRSMMPFIYNRKSESGVYNLRSKIVHEGISVGEKEAEQSIRIASHFLKILEAVNSKF